MRDSRVSHEPGGAPICPWCGVTALPGAAAGRPDVAFVCDEADCPGFGEPVTGG